MKLRSCILTACAALALLVTGCQTVGQTSAPAETERRIAADVCELFELDTKLTDAQIEAYRRAYAAYCEGVRQ